MADTFKLLFATDAGDRLELAAALVSHSAAWPIRFASHVYLKRDGAEQELMGAAAGKATYRLCFVGSDFAQRYRALVVALRKQNGARGTLTDPLVGTLRAVCTGVSDASRDLSKEKNAVNVTIGFEEDQLDAAVAAGQAASPGSAVAQVKPRAAIAKVAATPFPSAASTVALVVSTANLYASLAAEVIAGAADVGLSSRLAAVGSASDAAVAAVLSDPAATGARAYTAVSRLVDVYAACVAADLAIVGARPTPILFTVDGPVSVFVLAARLYGSSRARAEAAAIIAGNRLPDPLCIPAGKVLRLARPAA